MEYRSLLVLVVSVTACLCSECPQGKFKMRIDGTCETSFCMGECFNVFTCCVDLCFSLNMTSTLVKDCNIDLSTSTKSCSQHSEEVTCIAEITNSSPTICHEQLRWMKLQGMATFVPDIIEECPCENGYNRLQNTCLFDLCRNSTDCVNMTDAFNNESVCCFNDYLKPKDEICGTGKEITSTVIVENGADCISICQSTNTTCITSEGVFPACCGDEPVQPITNKKTTIFEGADGVVVALTITFSLTGAAAILFLVLFCVKRKHTQHAKRQSTDKENVQGLDSIEEEKNENKWENIFENFDIDEIERSVADDQEQTTATVKIIADINVEHDNLTEKHLFKKDTSAANISFVNTTKDMQEDTSQQEEPPFQSVSVTGNINEIYEHKHYNDVSAVADIRRCKHENSEAESNTAEPESSKASSMALSQSDSTAELINQSSDSDSICSFNSYIDGEMRFYRSTPPCFDSYSRQRSRSTTPLTLTVSLGDTIEESTKNGFVDIC